MRIAFTIFFILFTTSVFAQDFERVDAIVLKYPKQFSKTIDLSNRIKKDFITDSNKVRAIYTWIINNVAYDYSDTARYSNIEYTTLNEYYRIVSNMTLLNRHGVCAGYSRLFRQLCEEVGIKCYYVTGAARTGIQDLGKKRDSNHAWNIVVINNKKYLIDATWGAGTYNEKFERDPTYLYFMTKPFVFLRTHFPENELYFLTKSIRWQTFVNSPHYYRNEEQSSFQLMYPTTGYLKAGTNVEFKIYNKLPISGYTYSIGDSYSTELKVRKEGRFQLFNIELTETDIDQELVIYMKG